MYISDGMKPYFKGAALLGLAVGAGDTWLSASFGWSTSIDLMLLYGVISVASGILLILAAAFMFADHPRVGILLGVAWVPVFAVNCWTNMGASTATRMLDVQTAVVQRTKYDDIVKGRDALENELKLLESQKVELPKRLKDLTEAIVKGKDGSTWSVKTVPSSAKELDEAIAAKQLEIDNEEKRRGCRDKCESRKNELAHLKRLQETASAIEKNQTQYSATLKALESKKEQLSQTDAGFSKAKNQAGFHGKILFWTSKPDERQVDLANEGTGAATAIVVALLAAAMMFAGAYPHLLEMRTHNGQALSSPVQPAPRSHQATVSAPAPTVHVVEVDRPVYVDRVVERPAVVERPRPVIAAPAKPRVVREYINASKDKLVDYRDAAMRSVRTA